MTKFIKMDVLPSLNRSAVLLLTLCCLFVACELAPLQTSVSRVCVYQNIDMCREDPSKCNKTEEICGETQPYCYYARQVYSNKTVKNLQGCWSQTPDCHNKTECVSNNESMNVTFCCCNGDYCNRNHTHRPTVKNVPAIDGKEEFETAEHQGGLNGGRLVAVILSPFLLLLLCLPPTYYLYRKHKRSQDNPLSPDGTPNCNMSLDPNDLQTSLMLAQDSEQTINKLNMIEVKARGRFGCVWRGELEGRDVAVKVFPPRDKTSYFAEKEFYSLPQFGLSENVLQFISAHVRGNNMNTEYWLITEYQVNGSLYDYLKGHLVTWPELCKMALTMLQGLAFLHEDLPATKLAGHKPAIAHRDFKSKNVLVRKDLSVCVADFGLAIKFEPGKSVGDVHGQVGTRRYMAPEVLEGAINFNRDAFHRIDMYACGLVLWEIASRCKVIDGPIEEYQLPFEDLVGPLPGLDDMQEIVVQQKIRPKIKESWAKHLGMAGLKDTMEECWDQDPDARLSAGCVVERLAQLTLLDLTTSSLPVITATVTPAPPSSQQQHQSIPSPPAPTTIQSPPPPPPPQVVSVVPQNVTSPPHSMHLLPSVSIPLLHLHQQRLQQQQQQQQNQNHLLQGITIPAYALQQPQQQQPHLEPAAPTPYQTHPPSQPHHPIT